jgi:antitoxin YefM
MYAITYNSLNGEFSMTTLSASKARAKLFDLVKRANSAHEVYRIHHRSGDAVLISEGEYESLVETIELLSVPGFRASIRRSLLDMKEGRTYSLDEVFGKKA